MSFPYFLDLTSGDVRDGLDLTTGMYRAAASFLQELEKLLYFDTILFRCSPVNMGPVFSFANKLTDTTKSYRQLKWFTGIHLISNK